MLRQNARQKLSYPYHYGVPKNIARVKPTIVRPDQRPLIEYWDIDYSSDKLFSTDVPWNFNVKFPEQIKRTQAGAKRILISLVAYNITRDQTYDPPPTGTDPKPVPLYLWSSISRNKLSPFLALLSSEKSDIISSADIHLSGSIPFTTVGMVLYENKDRTIQPIPADKIVNATFRFKIVIEFT